MEDFKDAIQRSTLATGAVLLAFLAGSEAEGAVFKTMLAILVSFWIVQIMIIFAYIDVTKEDK